MSARSICAAFATLPYLALVPVGCGGRGPTAPPAPTVATADVVRGSLTLSREGATEAVAGRARVETGATVATGPDGRGALSLDSGAWVLLDRSSSLLAELGRVQLEAGRIWVDASQSERTVIDTAALHLVAHDATLAVSLEGGETVVYVGSGEVAFTAAGASGDGAEGTVAQGETLRGAAGQAPRLAPEAMWDDWTGGLADPARTRLRTVEPIGTLAGRRLDEVGVARSPLPIRGHDVRVSVTGDLATTQVTQTFFNARSDTLEGEWVIRIPRGAIVQSFEIDRGNGFERATPAAIGLSSGYSVMWMGPEMQEARLTYDGPERLRARIHPIEPGGAVQLRLRYTEWLDRVGNRRTYVYPMRGDGEPPLLSELVLDVDLRSAGVGQVRAGMGAVTENGHVVLRQSDARPHADFVLDLYDPPSEPPREGARVYTIGSGVRRLEEPPPEGAEAYALFDVPTEALGLADAPEQSGPVPLELVLLLDVSGATDPEDLEIARAVVESVLRQLAPEDRVTLRLADVRAHAPEGAGDELVPVNDATREALLASIARVDLGGATDLGTSLRQAASVVAGRPRGAVLYLGDALPTTGALEATSIRSVLATIDSPPRFFGLAIGETANVDLLRALFGESAAQVRDREAASRTVMTMLADAARPTLRGVTVDLGEGVERVYPRGPLMLPAGSHLRLVGRQADALPQTITVRGSRDGRAFEVTMPVVSSTLDDGGDVRRRWAVARLGELIDADAGREALVDLGLRFGIVTPWTSLALGGVGTVPLPVVRRFDRDPLSTPWSLGGGAPSVRSIDLGGDAQGWRRRLPTASSDTFAAAPESTWTSRVSASPPAAEARGDGGLARAVVTRTLEAGERGPRQCYERRAIVRPDLRGDVSVEVTVGPDGAVRSSRIVASSVGDRDVENCVVTEVRGLAFPATEGETVTVVHSFSFQVPERELGGRRECSTASSQPLEVRRQLWEERLEQAHGIDGVLGVYRQARAQCELSTWRARRTLLDLALSRFASLPEKVQLVRALSGDPSASAYLRRVILRFVSTPEQVQYVRAQLGLDPQVEWAVFARLWRETQSPEARLRVVRRWLEVAPDDLDLRLRLLSLLEQTQALPEARRVARALRADPLSDAKVRTEVGEFWLRQGDEAEARRVFSEIVEHTPLDPWARRRLGDLYRAHGWHDDAYREYRTLSVLRPDDGAVWLLLARAAAGAGRIDEALRLEQRLAESTDPGDDEGAAASARLWSWLRLSELAAEADDPVLRADARRRMRENGVLRDPPALLVALTFDHPDDAPQLRIRHPTFDAASPFEAAELGAVEHGVVASRVREREEGEYRFQVIRADRENLRDQRCTLVVLLAPGTPEERRIATEVVLTREVPMRLYALGADGSLVQAVEPAGPVARR